MIHGSGPPCYESTESRVPDTKWVHGLEDSVRCRFDGRSGNYLNTRLTLVSLSSPSHILVSVRPTVPVLMYPLVSGDVPPFLSPSVVFPPVNPTLIRVLFGTNVGSSAWREGSKTLECYRWTAEGPFPLKCYNYSPLWPAFSSFKSQDSEG